MTSRDHAEVFVGKDGDWYSRVVAANGNVIFDGSSGYANREDCVEMIRSRFGPIAIDYLNDAEGPVTPPPYNKGDG